MLVTTTLFLAYITKYLATGNVMASGYKVFPGAVASCDRTIPFGTFVKFGGKRYIVLDRTAKSIDERYNHKCFDIFTTETKKEALTFGKKKMLVTTLKFIK